MFENWLGRKKKVEGVNSDKNSVEGVAHFDGTKVEKDLFQDDHEHLQDKFDKNDSAERISDLTKKEISKHSTNWKELSTKVSNERTHPKLSERNSNWKEQEPFALDLGEDVEEAHLDAGAEINHAFEDGEHEEDDFDLEKAA